MAALALAMAPWAVAAAPANDDCASAIAVTALPFTDTRSVTGATPEATDPTFACEFGMPGPGHSVWYRFTAASTISLEADTFGSAFDSLVAVHRGSCGAFAETLACNDDDFDRNSFGGESRLVATVAAGETVYIEVLDLDTTGGTLVLTVKESPVFQVSKPADAYRAWRPGVAAQPDGTFLVVWNEYAFPHATVGRLHDATGAATGSRFQINTGAAGYSLPVVAAGGGQFVVVWYGGDDYDLVGRRLDASGAALGGEFSVAPASVRRPPAVAVDPAGNFLVAWTGADADGYGVFARRYDSAATPLGPPFQVNTYVTADQEHPAVAADGAGTFVVVWASGPSSSVDPGQDGDRHGVFGRRLDGSGAFLGGEFQVNTVTESNQFYPAVAAAAGGEFMVFWWSDDGDCFFCVDGRRYDASGTPQGGQIRVAADGGGSAEGRPLAAAADSDGTFVVTWPAPTRSVRSRRFAADGTPLGSPFQVTHIEDTYQYHPSVAALPAGDFVVVWDWSPFGSYYAIMGRVVEAAVTGNCPPEPIEFTCRTSTRPERTRVIVKDRTPDRGDALTWKWVRGLATALADFGDPAASDAYTLCLYDAGGLWLDVTVPPGGTCGARPCWRPLKRGGFKYVDRDAARGGIAKIVLRPGADGDARVVVKGKGAALAPPPLPLSLPVRAQLHALSGACWDATFTGAGVVVNTSTDFKATGAS